MAIFFPLIFIEYKYTIHIFVAFNIFTQSLADNDISDEGFDAIGDMLKQNKLIKYLNLSGIILLFCSIVVCTYMVHTYIAQQRNQ